MVTIAMPLKSFSYITWSRLAVLILLGSTLIGIEAVPVLAGPANDALTSLAGQYNWPEIEDYSLFNGLLHVNYVVSVITCLLVITAALIVSPVSNPTSITSFYVAPTAVGGKEDTSEAGTSAGKIQTTEGKEFFIFSLCTVLGATFLASCTDSLTLLLGLELQSFSVYVIAAQYKGYEPSEAAGLKYYLLGALSSAIVFMGLGVLYMSCGSTNFKFIAELGQVSNDPVKYLGYTLILIGFTWKIAAAPLHN